MRRSAEQWADAMADWLAWLHAAGRSEDTVRVRRSYVRRLAEAHLDRSPWKLTADDLHAWLAAGQVCWDREALKSARSSARSFYGWASAHGRVRSDPAALLPPVRVPPGLPRPAPERALEAALDAADDRARLMLLLGGYAGLRCGEIAGLPLAAVSEDGEPMIVRGKGGRRRAVPVHPRLRPELRAELARREAGASGSGWRYRAGLGVWLFPGAAGGPMAPGSVSRIVSRALGGPWTAHQLRHRFATRALAGTGDLRAVQELLGHSDPATTAIYTAVADAPLREAVDAV